MNNRQRLKNKIIHRIRGKAIQKALRDAEQAIRYSNHAITHATNLLKEGRIV